VELLLDLSVLDNFASFELVIWCVEDFTPDCTASCMGQGDQRLIIVMCYEIDLSDCRSTECSESVQARAYDNILSSYTGVPLSKGGSFDEEADRENATALFEAGKPSLLGFTRSQINGIWGPPLGIWRTMSFIFDIVCPSAPLLVLAEWHLQKVGT
jgi:hypothetical protein